MASTATAKPSTRGAPASDPEGTRPFAGFEWMLAGRYLRSRRKEAFISVIAGFSFIGIMLGVATLIVVMAVMNGFRQELLSKILGINGHVLIQPLDTPLTDFDAVKGKLEGLKGVTAVIPFVEGQALAAGPSGGFGALVRGVRQAELDKLTLVSKNIRGGTFEGFDEGKGVAIGTRLAQGLGLAVGDPITIVTPRGAQTPFGTAPRTKSYPVAAIFEIGMSEYDSTFVFMPFAEAQAYFNLGERASAIDVFIDDPDRVGELKRTIEESAGRSVLVTDWRQRNVTFFSALEVERNLMFIILTMIVLVAALNIISGLTMLVKDKGHDIAILRTMGATKNAIMRVFFITGAAIGTLGTLAGFILGLVICLNIESIRQFVSWLTRSDLFSPEIYFLTRLPAELNVGETTTVVVMGLVLSFLATLYPAFKAAKLDPVDALRYE